MVGQNPVPPPHQTARHSSRMLLFTASAPGHVQEEPQARPGAPAPPSAHHPACPPSASGWPPAGLHAPWLAEPGARRERLREAPPVSSLCSLSGCLARRVQASSSEALGPGTKAQEPHFARTHSEDQTLPPHIPHKHGEPRLAEPEDFNGTPQAHHRTFHAQVGTAKDTSRAH